MTARPIKRRSSLYNVVRADRAHIRVVWPLAAVRVHDPEPTLTTTRRTGPNWSRGMENAYCNENSTVLDCCRNGNAWRKGRRVRVECESGGAHHTRRQRNTYERRRNCTNVSADAKTLTEI